MNRKYSMRRSVLIGAGLMVWQMGAAYAVSTYTATPLYGLTQASGINESAQVAGQIPGGSTDDGWPHAALWKDGIITDLGLVGCRDTVSSCWSSAASINNSGVTVGETMVEDSWLYNPYWSPWGIYYAHEIRWDAAGNGTMLKTLGWEYGSSRDISDAGAMVGHGRSVDWKTVSGDYLVHGWFLKDGAVQEIGASGQASRALAVNENDQVTGDINTGSAHNAYLWQNGTATILSTGGSPSVGNDINDQYPVQVVGGTRVSGLNRAFLWQSDNTTLLPDLPDSSYATAMAVNNAGQAVGISAGKAVLWQDGSVYDLNEQVDGNSGLGAILSEAVDINDKGQILVKSSGGYFILTPDTVQPPVIINPPPVDADDPLPLPLPDVTPMADPKDGSLPPANVVVCQVNCTYSTIVAGLSAAGSGATVLVLDGVYKEAFILNSNKKLISLNGPDKTIVDASGSGYRVVSIYRGTIQGFTLAGGKATEGGGVYASYGTIIGNKIMYNSADKGGGFSSASYSTNYFRDNYIAHNTAKVGGGGTHNSYGTTYVEGNVFDSNSATNGGGFYIVGYSSLYFDRNRFQGNEAMLNGGGVYNTGYSGKQLKNSIFTANHAYEGGGIYCSSYSYCKVDNSTVTGNTSESGKGAGIGLPSYSGTSVRNSIVWLNQGEEMPAPHYGRPTVTYSIVRGGFAGTGVIDADPQFVDPAGGDFRLKAGSPAIDTGGDLSGLGVVTDIEGVARPVDGDGQGNGGTGDGSDYDIGAHEYQP